MAAAILQNIFCFCCRGHSETDDPLDESTHLIPPTIEPPVYGSNVILVNRKRLQERLSQIVRAKESKMVNVASKIPFNLHNRILPPEESLSRSQSGSVDGYRSTTYQGSSHSEFYVSRDETARQARAKLPYRPSAFSPTRDSDSYSRSPSPGSALVEQMRPILNAKLVGYDDTVSRGRLRGREPASPPSIAAAGDASNVVGAVPVVDVSQHDVDDSTPQQRQNIPVIAFKLDVTRPLTIDWGD